MSIISTSVTLVKWWVKVRIYIWDSLRTCAQGLLYMFFLVSPSSLYMSGGLPLLGLHVDVILPIWYHTSIFPYDMIWSYFYLIPMCIVIHAYRVYINGLLWCYNSSFPSGLSYVCHIKWLCYEFVSVLVWSDRSRRTYPPFLYFFLFL